MTACWRLKEASRIGSLSLWVPNHSQQKPYGACSAFQIYCQHTGFQASSLPPQTSAEELPSRPSLGGGRQGGPGPAPPMQCRNKREENGGPPTPAFIRNGRIPQGGTHRSSQLYSWPLMGTLIRSIRVRDAEAKTQI